MDNSQNTNTPVKMAVSIGDLRMKNPMLTASGTFGFGEEFADFIDLERLGGFIVKGTTLEPRQGNPYPRMAETPAGLAPHADSETFAQRDLDSRHRPRRGGRGGRLGVADQHHYGHGH